MSDTLTALHRAVIANPTDNTVRLVFADALDEEGGEANTARAEFIRCQIQAETLPGSDPERERLEAQARTLFSRHWIEWWHPVCVAAELPEPLLDARRTRKARASRRGQPIAGKPWGHTLVNTTVHLGEYGLSVRFRAGFPDEVRFLTTETPEEQPELIHHWGNALPLAHLVFERSFVPEHWERIAGSHLDRLTQLTFENLSVESSESVAASPHLAAITELNVHPSGGNTDVLRTVVSSPTWAGLRTLRFTRALAADAIVGLASVCTLRELETLDITLGAAAGLGALGQFLGELLGRFTSAAVFPQGTTTRWAVYGPALERLAGAPWIKQLRQLFIRAGGSSRLFGMLEERLPGAAPPETDVIPDMSVRMLANALNHDVLERLELPHVALATHTRDDLIGRFGDRVAFN